MHLSQIKDGAALAVVVREGAEAHVVQGADSTYALAMEAATTGRSLAEVVQGHGRGSPVDLLAMAAQGLLTLPLAHPDPAHLHLTGTGLTHLGSAATRDAMHTKAAAAAEETVSDSMKMFRMGLEGGKPAALPGVQPEWFYKGNGMAAVAPGAPLVSPGFAQYGGEEPEIAGLYVIAPDGTPARVGWTLANEFSDHIMERVNYLYLAHSKLRPASYGPEILVGDLPEDIEGTSRIRRAGEVIWEKSFLAGEANMSHSFANLEHHHFKYGVFCQPGDVHVHMFGTATLSFADGIQPRDGDVFEISAAPFGLPLVNPLTMEPPASVARVRAL